MHTAIGCSRVTRLLVCVVLLLVPLLSTAEDWPTYLRDPGRSAASQETWLSTANAGSLTRLWSFNTGDVIAASPTVVNNVVYVGSWNGDEYAINAVTGALIWKTFLGTTTPASDCSPGRTLGVTSAATVQNGVVYVGGGDDYWYALNAASGSVLWKVYVGDSTATGGNYNWSSPLIYDGYGYIGVASFGDCPLVQGKLLKVDLATQQVVGTFDVVPDGTLGGGIWSSPALDTATGIIYVATGSRTLASQTQAQAIVAINASTMTPAGSWAIPFPQPAIADADFGVTPTLFTDSAGDQLVAAANKNGTLYALERNNMGAGPVWTDQIADGGASPQYGQGTVSSGIFAHGMLLQAGGQITVNGTEEQGSVDAINPDNGSFIWRHFTQNAIIPALASINGLVLDAEGPTLEVLDAATGNPLYSYTTGAVIYSAPSISNGRIFFGSGDGNLYALGLPSSAPVGTATPTATTTPLPAPGPITSLYNNAGTVTDGVVSTSNYDGYGYAYSAQALAAAGIARGGTVTAGGLTFTWPDVTPGSPDNVVAAGQTILLPAHASGTTLGFLGAATSGPSGGTATITYTDGSTQNVSLAFSDWALGAVSGLQPLPGTSIVADMNYRDNAAGIPDTTAAYVFYAGFGLAAGKTVQSVTLPSSVNGGPLHIFSLAVGTPGAGATTSATPTPTASASGPTDLASAFNNAGIARDNTSTGADFDGYGYAYSAQALAAAGIVPGGMVMAGGLAFTWPNVTPGKPDNVEAGAVESGGQTITLPAPPGATTLGFLGAATTGPTGGVGTITYTDGSTQDFKLQFSDWALSDAAGVQPLPGTSIVASMPYRDTASGAADPIPVYVFYTGFTLAPGKTVQRVTLPAAVPSGSIHVFAMTIGTPASPTLTRTPTVTPTVSQPTVTDTVTASATATVTRSDTATAIVPATSTSTATATTIVTATATSTESRTSTGTPTTTATPTVIPTQTGTSTWTATQTDVPTQTSTPSATATQTGIPTQISTATGTAPQTATATASLPVATDTITITGPVATRTATAILPVSTVTPTLSNTPINQATGIPSTVPTAVPTVMPTTTVPPTPVPTSYVPPVPVSGPPAPILGGGAPVALPPSNTPTLAVPSSTDTGTPVPPSDTPTMAVPTDTSTTMPLSPALFTPTQPVATSAPSSTATPTFTPIPPTATVTPSPTRIPILLIVHNAPRTVTGGRIKACDARGNSLAKPEPGCEVVSSTWIPHLKVVYALTYPDGTRQTFATTSDGHGNALHAFTVQYRPSQKAKHGQPATIARISVMAMNKNGRWTAPDLIRFAVLY